MRASTTSIEAELAGTGAARGELLAGFEYHVAAATTSSPAKDIELADRLAAMVPVIRGARRARSSAPAPRDCGERGNLSSDLRPDRSRNSARGTGGGDARYLERADGRAKATTQAKSSAAGPERLPMSVPHTSVRAIALL